MAKHITREDIEIIQESPNIAESHSDLLGLRSRRPKLHEVAGKADFLNGDLLALYWYDGKVWIYLNGDFWPIRDVSIRYRNWLRSPRLIIESPDGQSHLVRGVYKYRFSDFMRDFFMDRPFSEIEDYDFCLYVFNVWRDKDRQDRLFQPYRKACIDNKKL